VRWSAAVAAAPRQANSGIVKITALIFVLLALAMGIGVARAAIGVTVFVFGAVAGSGFAA
jgi:hypothetical protein